jgi:hypothetical protein
MNTKIYQHYEHIVCADGAAVSIQAGLHVRSTPRNNRGPYTHIEAGFPSVEPPASWREYAEDGDNLLDTVYGYMPYDCVDEFIDIHGGMVSGELPPRL